jgi:hypothetical protein
MGRRFVWLGFVCACTQDFSVFEPDAAQPVDGSADVANDAAADVAQESSAIDAPQDVATDAPVACTESGAIMFGGHCYWLVTQNAKQAQAATACMNAGAHLVTITSSAEQSAVVALGNTERWTDLYRTTGAATDANYAWLTGESRNGYSAWAPNEPNNTGQCATLLGTGLWNDQNCGQSLDYICERE